MHTSNDTSPSRVGAKRIPGNGALTLFGKPVRAARPRPEAHAGIRPDWTCLVKGAKRRCAVMTLDETSPVWRLAWQGFQGWLCPVRAVGGVGIDKFGQILSVGKRWVSPFVSVLGSSGEASADAKRFWGRQYFGHVGGWNMRTILIVSSLFMSLLLVGCNRSSEAYFILAPGEIRELLDDGSLADGGHYVTGDDVGRDREGYFLSDGGTVLLRLVAPDPILMPCLDAAIATGGGGMVWGRYDAPGSLVEIVRVTSAPYNGVEVCLLD